MSPLSREMGLMANAALTPLKYRDRKLDNGLRVLTLEEHSSPIVAVQVWYKVGSKDDPAGRSGFAHLFEHIMFKGTRNMKPEMIDRLTEDVGGYNNASTSDDFTHYYAEVPANCLQSLLWAEAERLCSLEVNEANFQSEREVVKEEFRQRILAPPYGMFWYLIDQKSFTHHPYRRPTIGSIEDLEAASLEDVQAFHAGFYRPDNAVLVIAGDFDAARLDAWVDTYFGPIPNPGVPLSRVTAKEPLRTKASRHTVHGPNVPLPAVALTYLVPPAAAADAAALRLLQAVLSEGESSRLYQSLVYRQQISQEAFANAELREEAGLFVLGAIAASGKTAPEIESALAKELERLQEVELSQAELDKAKNQLITTELRERQTCTGKAELLGEATVVLGDPDWANAEIERLQQASVADVQRVAGTYFAETNRLVIEYLPETIRKISGRTKRKRTRPVPARAAIRDLQDEIRDREAPPPPGPEMPFRMPEPCETTLPNGLRVIVLEKPDVPLVSLHLMVRSGAEVDPADKSGLTDMTAGLVTKGTTTRTAPEIVQSLESLGGLLESGASWDASNVHISVMADKIVPAMEILEDAVRRPAFSPDELERLRRQLLDDLKVSLREPGTLAGFVTPRVVFGSSPYGHPLSGTRLSLGHIKRRDIVALHERYYRPDNVILVAAGRCQGAEIFKIAERLFAGWPRPHGTLSRTPTCEPDPVMASAGAPHPQQRVVAIHMAGAGQAAVAVAGKSVRRGDPEYFCGLVANSILGGGYSARLNQEIRIKRGLSYGAASTLDARLGGGIFVAAVQTKNDSAAEVVSLIVDQLERLRTEAVPASELGPRKAVLIGNFGRSLQTTDGLVGRIASLALYGLGLEEINDYIPCVQAVSAAEVQQFARRHLVPEDFGIIVVGDASKFCDGLGKRFPQLEVIPLAKLSLETESLRKRR